MKSPVILASTSPFRKHLLTEVGLSFSTAAPDVDERAIEGRAEHQHFSPEQLADLLACEKALAVSRRHDGALVIGGDQVMALGERIYHKPKDMTAARDQLLSLRGETHILYSALALARDGEIIWRHVSLAHMTVRMFSEAFLDDYLEHAGDKILKSVGGYQIEGRGLQLFSAVEGDYFTIVGVPLLPLLDKLRHLDILHA